MRMTNRVLRALAAALLLAAAGSVFARGFVQNPDLLDRIRIGVTTAKEVEAILGPPSGRSHFPRLNLVSMDYTIPGDSGKNRVDVGVLIGEDGIVRDIQKIPQYCG